MTSRTRIGIYCRVSQDKRNDHRSVTEQEQACREWVDREKANGWAVAGAWADDGISASKYGRKARPAWQLVTEALDAGKLDVLMVWEPSRATRDRRVWAALAAACEEHGVKIGCNGRLYDLTDGEDAFMLDLLFSLASRESSVTRKRVLRSVAGNSEAGRPHGKLPYGYRIVKQDNGPNLRVPDEWQAPIVREVATRVLHGEALYSVARDLNDRKVSTSRTDALTRLNKPVEKDYRWTPEQVRRLCLNPAYAGKRVHRGKVLDDVETTWEALFTEATWQGLRARLTAPERRTNEGRGPVHFLSGVAVCGVCAGTMRVAKNRQGLSYQCKDAFHVTRRKDLLEQLVARNVVLRLERPDVLDLLVDGDDAAVRERAADEVVVLRARLDEHYSAAALGEISARALGAIEGQLLPRIEAAEALAARPALSPLLESMAGPRAQARWEALTVDQKRELTRLLMTVRVLPVGKGHRVFDPSSVEIAWRSGPDWK